MLGGLNFAEMLCNSKASRAINGRTELGGILFYNLEQALQLGIVWTYAS
jgi:hypothetical protein